jgi:hypothetical protein
VIASLSLPLHFERPLALALLVQTSSTQKKPTLQITPGVPQSQAAPEIATVSLFPAQAALVKL